MQPLVGIIDVMPFAGVTMMTDKTIGIVLLVLGIIALIWPHWAEVVLGLFLILFAVLMLMGKTRIIK
jgi:hypothetical protein